MHCEASPKGPRSLSGVQKVALAEEAEAVVEGCAEAGARRQRQLAWAAGSPERSPWRVCTQAWHPEAQVRQLRPHSNAFAGAEGERCCLCEEVAVEALLHQQIHHRELKTKLKRGRASHMLHSKNIARLGGWRSLMDVDLGVRVRHALVACHRV